MASDSAVNLHDLSKVSQKLWRLSELDDILTL